MLNVSIIINNEFPTDYRLGILVIDYNRFFWTLVLVLKIFQENLVIFTGKSNDFYKKISLFLRDNLTVLSRTFGDSCRKIFTIFGRKFNYFYEKIRLFL